MERKIDTTQITEAIAYIDNMTNAFKTITKERRFLSSVGQLLASRAKQNIADGGSGGVSYVLLKPATKAEKRKHGYSLKPLQRTGQMMRSISFEAGSGSLLLTGRDIIVHHQYGAPKINLPKREVFTIDKEDEEDIRDILVRRLKTMTNI